MQISVCECADRSAQNESEYDKWNRQLVELEFKNKMVVFDMHPAAELDGNLGIVPEKHQAQHGN